LARHLVAHLAASKRARPRVPALYATGNFFHCLEPSVWHPLIFDVVDADDRGVGFLVRRLEKEEWRGCRGPTPTTQVLAAKS